MQVSLIDLCSKPLNIKISDMVLSLCCLSWIGVSVSMKYHADSSISGYKRYFSHHLGSTDELFFGSDIHFIEPWFLRRGESN
ncbi:hypothetical protein BRARA_E01354 [Brassica rapa]|uniref:Uncharacterized protein n=1 Tax=Brassica campestris TaxID=3711 RepID=A0A397ZBB5_BRACM|nr:hypothetical protein BRARA_E01354 [Brassica rapa]